MANYKVVDADKLDANLTSVADSIRAKTGSTEAIAFPDGFKTEIEGISAGGVSAKDIAMGTLTEAKSTEATNVMEYAFYKQSQLKTVDLPNVTEIAPNAFSYCSSLDSLNVSNVTSLGNNAFRECAALGSVNMPLCNVVVANGQYAFYNCRSLTEVNMPLLPMVGAYMFYNCLKLTSIDCPLATRVFSYVFYGNTVLESANFPMATSVGGNAFQACYQLKNVNFNSLQNVEQYAFANNKFEVFDAPLESISTYAFSSNPMLKTLVIRNTEAVCTLANTNAFYGCYRFLGTVNNTYNPNGLKGDIYVPSALLESYKTATNWTTYASQFRALEDYTVDGTVTGALDESKI